MKQQELAHLLLKVLESNYFYSKLCCFVFLKIKIYFPDQYFPLPSSPPNSPSIQLSIFHFLMLSGNEKARQILSQGTMPISLTSHKYFGSNTSETKLVELTQLTVTSFWSVCTKDFEYNAQLLTFKSCTPHGFLPDGKLCTVTIENIKFLLVALHYTFKISSLHTAVSSLE